MRIFLAVLLALVVPAGTAAAALPPPVLQAIPIIMLFDSGSGQTLYAREPDRRFLPASMTKVMTAFVAFEEMAKGRLDPHTTYVVRPDTAGRWSGQGTSLSLKSGMAIDVDTLLRAITTVSANDAAVVLAEGYAGDVIAWTGLMSAQARRLGMSESHFATPNGWPDQGATHVSARDLVTLADAMIARHPALYHRYFGQKRMLWNGVELQNHDPTVGVVPGADGIKTGHTREAGYNFLGAAQRGGRRLIMVIGGARSESERAMASRALLEWGFAAWRDRPLFRAGASIVQAKVQDGAVDEVPLVAARDVYAAVEKTAPGRIALEVAYDGPLMAPLAKGALVGMLEIRVDGKAPGRIPLHAGAAVAKAGLLDRLINGIRALVS